MARTPHSHNTHIYIERGNNQQEACLFNKDKGSMFSCSFLYSSIISVFVLLCIVTFVISAALPRQCVTDDIVFYICTLLGTWNVLCINSLNVLSTVQYDEEREKKGAIKNEKSISRNLTMIAD